MQAGCRKFDPCQVHQFRGNTMKKERKADPMKTKTGKPRLGPLNLVQLNDMLTKSNSAKQKSKVRNRIAQLEHRSK